MTHRRPHPPLSFLLVVVVLLLSRPSPSRARRAMGGGLGDDEEDDHGSASGASTQGRMRSSLCRVHWKIDPLVPADVRSAAADGSISRELADHVSGILGKKGEPLHVRLRDRPVAASSAGKKSAGGPALYSPAGGPGGPADQPLRAVGSVGRLASLGRRVRASWTSGPPARPSRGSFDGDGGDAQLLRMKYEEAQLRNYNRVEIEVTLPRVKSGGALPAVVYTFPVGEGEVNPQGFVAAGRGVVRVYPEGRKKADKGGGPGRSAQEAGQDDGGVEVGRIAMRASAPPGLVDPSWAKGRKFFWKGRPAGKM